MAKTTNDISESPRLVRDILGVFHLTMAVLLGIAYYGSFNSLGRLGDLLRLVGRGLFGSFSYGLPLVFLIWAFLYLLERRKEISRARIMSLFVCILLIAALFSIFTLSVSELKTIVAEQEISSLAGFNTIASLWSHGLDPSIQGDVSSLSGGLLGGLIGQSLSYIASVPGAAVIIAGFIVASIIYGFSLSPSRYLADLSNRHKRRIEEKQTVQTETAAKGAENDGEVSKKGTLLPGWMEDDTKALEADLADSDDAATEIWDNSPYGSPVFKNENINKNGEGLNFPRPPAAYSNKHDTQDSLDQSQPFVFPDEDKTKIESDTTGKVRPAVLYKDNALSETITSERDKWEDRSEAKTAQLAAESRTKSRSAKGKTSQQMNLFSDYKAPPLSLLRKDKALQKSSSEISNISNQGRKLEETLDSFGVEAKIVNYTTGPTITRYELSPGPGVKVSRIVNLADDIALSLAATSVRIEAPIPGKPAIGVEIPNRKASPVLLRGLLEDSSYKSTDGHLVTPLGRNAGGDVILCDITKMPHVLIAGATGSGKSVCINNILISLLYRYSPKEMRLLMIDPKIVELNIYNGIPHLLQPVVTDPEKAYGVLNWAVAEMEKRYKLFADSIVRDISSYNLLMEKQKAAAVESGDDEVEENMPETLPYILIVIDELADLMATTSRQLESAISRLMAKARAAGIHVLIATQRPSVDVITGVIKANIPSRIAFAVTSQVDSRTILDTGGAERLLGKGDMLYYPQSVAKPIRGQGAFVSDLEVEGVLKYIKDYYPSDYDETVADALENPDGADVSSITGEEEDELLIPALRVLVENGYASVSLLQRKLTVGYPRAARMIDRLNELGYVGPFEGSKPRDLLITAEQFEKLVEDEENGNA